MTPGLLLLGEGMLITMSVKIYGQFSCL